MKYSIFKGLYDIIPAFILSMSLVACGGGGGGSSGPDNNGNHNGNNDNGGNNGSNNNGENEEVICAENIGVVVDALGTTTPTWEELGCFTEGLARFEKPSFIKRILLGSDTLPENATAWIVHLEQVEETWADWPINVGNTLPGPMPPYLDIEGRTYPMTAEALDLEMRSYAAVLLEEKLTHNRPLYFAHFWPPYAVNEFDSEEAYRTWLEDIYLPELEVVSDTAEFVKAEYFIPYLLEVEQLANGLGDWFEVLSEQEKLAIGQEFIDRVYEVVRPRYNGVLVASSYTRYTLTGDFWMNLSFAEYDQIDFAIFPECNLEVTEAYVDDQLENYMAIVTRDSVPYMISELTVYREKLFENPCPSFDFEANEAALYQLVFDKLDALPIAPIGLSAGAPHTENAKAAMEVFFNSH